MKQSGCSVILICLLLFLLCCCTDSKKDEKPKTDITTKSSGNRSSYWYDSPSECRRKTGEMVESWKNGEYEKRTGHKPPLYGDE